MFPTYLPVQHGVLADAGVVAAHDAGSQVAVSAEVLGRAVDDDIGAVLQRTPEARVAKVLSTMHGYAALLRQLDDPASPSETMSSGFVTGLPASSDRRPTVQDRWYPRSLPDDCTPTA